ncbi:hypothetical protein [Actinomadura flavalba]|uniref:hypothetical protein n=1 Tax=Actinomadura flavalba TaxID=1120938 RepID=UPI00035DC6D6|nr:hypothetical protein [Actinomadura flavalba]
MLLRSAAAATALTLALCLWWAAPRAHGNDRWELVADEKSVAYGRVVATGEREAWAFGWKTVGVGAWLPMADGPHRPTAFHWTGGRWTERDLPVGRGHIGAVAASGPSNVWALTGASVLRWDGRAWTVMREQPATAGGLAVIAADDVWIFGARRAWHYDGRTWSERPVPFTAFRVSARSSSDIWALDDVHPWVHHFDGGTWTRTDLSGVLPKAPPASGEAPPGPLHAGLGAITADASGVWITGEIGASSFLLHGTGSGWRSENTSATAGRMTRDAAPLPDGSGGHWFLGSTDPNGDASALAHRTATGHWTRIPTGGELTSLSTTPGGPLFATGTIGRARGVFRSLALTSW